MRAILVAALVVAATALENQLPTLTDLLNDDNLLQQFRQWQLSMQPQNNVEHTSPTRNYGGNNDYGGNNNYGGNPWLQPQPQPTAPPSRPPPPPPYGEQPGNPWYQPPAQPQPEPHPQPAPQPIPQPYPPQTQPPPQTYPPVTHRPVYPPAVTNPPVDPAVEALRKYCVKPRGQFPSKYCNKYVNCWDDSILVQECPKGLLFSTKGYCDYEFNVDCHGRIVKPGPEVPTTMPEGSKNCPTPFGNYRSSANCSEFYVCAHGAPVKFCCPTGLYYSTELGVCDYPYNVDCFNPRPLPHPDPQPYPQPYPQPQPQPQPYPTDPIWNPYLQRIPAGLLNDQKTCIPNSVYRLNSDCSSVAVCRAGKTEVINCGHNTGFNSDQGLCVARHLAKC